MNLTREHLILMEPLFRSVSHSFEILPLIYTTPAYTIIFVGVIVLSRVSEVVGIYWRRSQRDPNARQADRGSLVIGYGKRCGGKKNPRSCMTGSVNLALFSLKKSISIFCAR